MDNLKNPTMHEYFRGPPPRTMAVPGKKHFFLLATYLIKKLKDNLLLYSMYQIFFLKKYYVKEEFLERLNLLRNN